MLPRPGASHGNWWRRRCAACANLLPPVESIYWWEEKVESANETLVLFKTSADRYDALETTLRQLHPYEVPEIIAFRIEQGLPEYLQWVLRAVRRRASALREKRGRNICYSDGE